MQHPVPRSPVMTGNSAGPIVSNSYEASCRPDADDDRHDCLPSLASVIFDLELD
jgi:hypothetical protein